MDNLSVIARGGGSPQARSHNRGCDCPVCNPEEEVLSCPYCGKTTEDGDYCAECQTTRVEDEE